MKIGFTHTFQFVLLLLSISGSTSSAPFQVSGLHSNELPLPLIYDTFIPVVYEYEIPNWKKNDFILFGENYCRNTTYPQASCSIYFPIMEEINKLYVDFQRPVVDEKGDKNYYESQNSQINFCNLIQTHFPSVSMQKDDLLFYYQNLKRCYTSTTGIGIIETGIQDYNMDIKQPFSDISIKFYENYYEKINNNTLLMAVAILISARTALQSTLLSALYTQKYRWSHAVQDCGAYRIPESLVSSQKLSETLKTISLKEKFKGLELTIPLSLISKYYSYSIADCTYTKDSFVVRLQIPVRYKKNALGNEFISPYTNLQFFSLTPVPFYLDDLICTMANINSHYNYIYNNFTKEAYSVSECNSGKLCYSPFIFKHTNYRHCEGVVLSGNREEIESECKIDCRKASNTEKKIGIITQVSSDKFILTGKPGLVSARVKCNSETSHQNQNPQVFEVTIQKDGAIEISLSCNCYIDFDGRNFYPGSKCGSQFYQTHITPLLPSKY